MLFEPFPKGSGWLSYIFIQYIKYILYIHHEIEVILNPSGYNICHIGF